MTKRRFPIPTRKSVPRHEYAPRPLRRFRADPAALCALSILSLVAVAVLLAPALTPYDPLAMNPGEQLLPPGPSHPAGTDLFGRDVATRLLYGGRLTLGIAALSVLIASLMGTAMGLLAGYYGRATDRVIGWLVDVLLSFPSVLLALTIVAALGPGVPNVVVAVAVAGIPTYTRMVRGQVLAARRQPYVRAAASVGCTDWRILVRHILPNTMGPLVVLATLSIGWAILSASALSFLGLGVQPPAPEWGAMLNDGRGYLRAAPWMTAAPGLAIALTVVAVNLLGDALRDMLDPQSRVRSRG
jgi:peptide/nickel transport system permease protein